MVDAFGTSKSFQQNVAKEYERNLERYNFLRRNNTQTSTISASCSSTGICHQVKLEYLAQTVWTNGDLAYPDTVVGTDSHTTDKVNGLWCSAGASAASRRKPPCSASRSRC